MVSELAAAFGIVAVCVVLHVICMVTVGEWLVSHRRRDRQLGSLGYTGLLIVVFAIVIFLHMVETAIWAIFYYYRSLFQDFETALYFSITSYTTIGFGDVVLPRAWRMLGGIEGISGVLLCGLSTAFIFAVVNAMFRMRVERGNKSD